jgi:hypothetical protein
MAVCNSGDQKDEFVWKEKEKERKKSQECMNGNNGMVSSRSDQAVQHCWARFGLVI